MSLGYLFRDNNRGNVLTFFVCISILYLTSSNVRLFAVSTLILGYGTEVSVPFIKDTP